MVDRMRLRRLLSRQGSGSTRLALIVAATLVVAGCTDQAASTESEGPVPGRSDCASPTQILEDGPFAPEIEGSSDDGLKLFGQIQASDFLVASDAVKKVVWRVTGSGEPTVTLAGPGGVQSELAWGPEYHQGSNYDLPGDEYGSVLVLDRPGCWHIQFRRGSQTAGVWLMVGAAE